MSITKLRAGGSKGSRKSNGPGEETETGTGSEVAITQEPFLELALDDEKVDFFLLQDY